LSSHENIALLCNFLSIQKKLVNLSLKDGGFKLDEVLKILQTILDADLVLLLQRLDLSQNTLRAIEGRSTKLRKQVIKAMCDVITGSDKLAVLDLQDTRLVDEDVLTIAKVIKEESTSLQALRVTLHEGIDGHLDAKQLLLELFDIPYVAAKDRGEPKPTNILGRGQILPSTSSSKKTNQAVIDYFVQHGEAKLNRKQLSI